MPISRTLIATATALLSLATAAIAPARAAVAPDFSALAAGLERACADGTFAGVVVVRVRGGDAFQHACGQADLVNGVPMTRATRFKIYSTSKLVTALAVMKLVEDGKLSLDASIRDYLPEAPSEWTPVTLRQLLNHTSGVADLSEALIGHFRSDHPTAMRELLTALAPEQRALVSAPGQAYRYNNYGFELLAEAAARAAGQPFAEVVEALVFRPAGMRTARIEAPNLVAGHAVPVREDGLAIGYNGEPDNLVQAYNWAFVQLGAGAVHASVEDFVALDAALKAGSIVAPATLERMTAEPSGADGQPAASGATYGLGIVTSDAGGVRMQGHTGGTNGYITDFQRFPDDDAMLIAMSNRGFTDTRWLRDATRQALKAARRQPATSQREEKAAGAPAAGNGGVAER
ncbi:serine hydrolase [Luteimonas sp. RD2P54]|uniref:Serine hydrolase n=1 Tax=Luteimonas endophytica TaxID=3042023 RepID=A0ABT6JDU5_9GAMM|nr:serine hydrolase domain-containing protein [Luteimonas endophytica]MDH5825003.1 serine hydrolase [Luteimonas endophytica]